MTFPAAIADALRLTRSGRLKEATLSIQSALRPAPAAPPQSPAGEVIDLVPERVEVAARPGGTFDALSHQGPEGTIAYRLYRPANAAPGMPLVVMLHGCTQSPEDFARGTAMNRLADEHGVLVAYPAQSPSANAQRCWNWFRPGDQARDRGEPALLAGVTRRIVAEHAVDPARVYVAGLSAGGAAAAIMAAAYPDLFAAVGVHSGLACGSARDLPGALTAMRRGAPGAGGGGFVPVITFHGDADKTVHDANSDAIVAAAFAARAAPLVTEREEGQAGRRYTRAISRDADGRVLVEQWTIHGAGHAWSGGSRTGSYTDPRGPDASREMVRFFLDHRLAAA